MTRQIVIATRMDNGTTKKVHANDLPWERAILRGLIAQNGGGNGGPVFGMWGRPEMTVSDWNKLLLQGGALEDLGLAGGTDWDCMFTTSGPAVPYVVDLSSGATLQLFNAGTSVLWITLLFNELSELPHHRQHDPRPY